MQFQFHASRANLDTARFAGAPSDNEGHPDSISIRHFNHSLFPLAILFCRVSSVLLVESLVSRDADAALLCCCCVVVCSQPDQVTGDVVVVLEQQPHSTFKRDGHNLFHKHSLTLLEALTGFSFPLQHLDGRVLLVKSDAGAIVKPGDVRAIKEEGMPQVKNPYVRGNIYIEFDVVFPESKQLSEASKKVLKTVLPPAPNQADSMSDAGTPVLSRRLDAALQSESAVPECHD